MLMLGSDVMVRQLLDGFLGALREVPEVQAELLRDYRRHYGPIVSDHFQAALEAALEAAQSDGSGRSPAPAEEKGSA